MSNPLSEGPIDILYIDKFHLMPQIVRVGYTNFVGNLLCQSTEIGELTYYGHCALSKSHLVVKGHAFVADPFELVDVCYWPIKNIQILTVCDARDRCISFWFRTIDTDQPHPDAFLHETNQIGSIQGCCDEIQISTLVWDETLVIVASDQRAFAFNWTKGHNIKLPPCSAASILNEHVLLLWSDPGALVVFSLQSESTKSRLAFKCTDLLQPLAGVTFLHNRNVPPYDTFSFETNIMGVELHYDCGDHEETFTHIIHIQELLKLARNSSSEETIPWESWSPWGLSRLARFVVGRLCIFGPRVFIRMLLDCHSGLWEFHASWNRVLGYSVLSTLCEAALLDGTTVFMWMEELAVTPGELAETSGEEGSLSCDDCVTGELAETSGVEGSLSCDDCVTRELAETPGEEGSLPCDDCFTGNLWHVTLYQSLLCGEEYARLLREHVRRGKRLEV